MIPLSRGLVVGVKEPVESSGTRILVCDIKPGCSRSHSPEEIVRPVGIVCTPYVSESTFIRSSDDGGSEIGCNIYLCGPAGIGNNQGVLIDVGELLDCGDLEDRVAETGSLSVACIVQDAQAAVEEQLQGIVLQRCVGKKPPDGIE